MQVLIKNPPSRQELKQVINVAVLVLWAGSFTELL